jgi:hypothetical protein
VVALEQVDNGLELLRVGAHDTQLIVVIAGKPHGGEHLGHGDQTALELGPVDPLAQPDVAQQRQPTPERRWVEVGVVAPDHSFAAQPPDPLGHGVGGQPYRSAEILVRRAGVGEKECYELPVNRVHESRVTFVGLRAKFPRNPRQIRRTCQELRDTFGPKVARVMTVVVVLLRLTLTPLTVLVASLVQQRLGPTVGGRVIGLPLTTGPFLLLLCLGSGVDVAANSAAGVVAGQLAVVGFCLGYGHVALRRSGGIRPSVPGRAGTNRWVALAAALAAAVAGTAVSALVPTTVVLVLLVLATISIGLATWPTAAGPPPPPRVQRSWEIPVRMGVSGTLVASLLGLAPVLGPHVAGVLATMPVILTVLAPATHRREGPAAAAALVRGALGSMPSSVVFVAVLGETLVPLGTAAAFAVAAVALVLTDLTVITATAVIGIRTRRSTAVPVPPASTLGPQRWFRAAARTAGVAVPALDPAPVAERME